MNFVFLSTMQWENTMGSYAPGCLSIELAARGHACLFVQPYNPVTHVDTQGLSIRVVGLESLGLANLLVSLARRGIYIDSLDPVLEQLRALLDEFETPGEPRIAILNAPFDPLVRLLPLLQARGYYLVYFPQDDYADMARLGYAEFNVGQAAYLAERVDLIITLSEWVAAKLRGRGRTVEIVPDAIRPDEFRRNADAPPPAEILKGETATLGFWGTLISAMVDAELLLAIARAKPEWAINLIGPYDLVPGFAPVHEPLQNLPNIRFLGEVPHAELIRYAHAFDVCLLPGPDNDMSRGRDPLKVYEYLAAYKPVVATHMPQLEGFPYVRIADSAAQTIDAIQAALREPVEHARVDEFLASHTWSVRTDCLVTHIQALLAQPRGRNGALETAQLQEFGRAQPIGALTPHEAASLVALVRDYGRALQDLERVTAHAQEVEAWAHSLESANREQQQALDRLYQLPPLRLARRVRNYLRRAG